MIHTRIKFRHLQCFLEVARLKSVVNAADSLRVTQPAVSKTLKELEDILGVRVLDRSRAGVELTAHGSLFLRYASVAMTALKQGVDSVANALAQQEPVLPIGVLPSVAARIIPRSVQDLLAEIPNARVRLSTGPNDYLLEQLRIGRVDLVVGRLSTPAQMVGLSFEHLYSERIVLVVRPGHPLLQADPAEPQDLAAWPLVLPGEGAIIHEAAQRFLVARGLDGVAAAVETVSPSFGRSFVQDTDAVWVISYGVVVRDLADGLLAALPVNTGDTLGPVGLTRRADEDLPPAATSLITILRRLARASDDGPPTRGPLGHMAGTPAADRSAFITD